MCLLKLNNRGFTLIEMIVSFVLISIMAAVAGFGFIKIAEGYVFAKQNAETMQKVQMAMSRMSKELGALTAISSADPQVGNTISYTRLPGPVTNTITLSGNTITIAINGGNAATLIDQVTAFNLAYSNAAGTATTNAADIRQINIALTVTGANNQQLAFTNQVQILESYW